MKKFIFGFLAIIISTLNFLNLGSIESVQAVSVSTDLYATEGVDTTSILGHNLTPSELNRFKYNDSDQYKIRGRWNKVITDWDKLELKNFKPKLPNYAEIQEVHLTGSWSRNNKDLDSAWIKIFKPGDNKKVYLTKPNPGIDNNTPGDPINFDINLSDFISSATDLNDIIVRFQAKTDFWSIGRSVTWHDQLKLAVEYNDLGLEGGTVYDAPDSTFIPYEDHDWSKNTDKIAASWNGFSGADIIKYKVGLGTTQGSTNICSFTDKNPGDTQIEFTDSNCSGISLLNEQIYYFTVRAYTHFCPDIYKEVTSNGITIDTTNPIININDPLDDEYLNKTFDIDATASDIGGSGLAEVSFQLTNASLQCKDADGNTQACPYYFSSDNDGSDGWTADYNSLKVPDGKYNLKATAFDNAGNTGQDDIYINIDNTPPANPTLNVETSSTQARVYWNSIPDAVSYNLFKDGKLIAENVIFTSYTDKDVVAGETYNYRVTAKDNLGNENTGSDIDATIPEPGEIISSATSRLAATLDESDTPLPKDEEEDQGEILGTNVDKTGSEDEDEENGNYSGWIYLLLLYILIILGYYYYYLRDDYTPWFWVFPLIVGLILLFINNSLTKVLESSNMAKLFWLWELIVFIIFVVYYQFFGRPIDESEILKKYKVKPKKK
ncbi:hypothetical protein ACFL14_02600 [Patescibacteria group bacterium]